MEKQGLNSQSGIDNLIAREIGNYLSSSRLSMTGLASKLNISKAQLSLIKNNKKTPGLDLGLKILKYIGTKQETRKQWAIDYFKENSDEYEELENSVNEEIEKIKLSQSVSNRFENNLTLVNLYLDIINADNGISVYVIEKNYGKEISSLIMALSSAELIQNNNGVLSALNQRSILTKRSSFNFIKTVFDDQKDQFETGQWDGKFQFVIDDIDEKGKEKLQKLMEETMRKASQIAKEHEQPRSKGGRRFIFQILQGILKGPMLCTLFILITGQISTYAKLGGLEGGASNRGGLEGGASTDMHLHFTSKQGLYQIEDRVENLIQEIDVSKSKIFYRAFDKCTENFRYVRRSDVQIKLEKVSYDRFWINKKENYEALIDLNVYCGKNKIIKHD